ncbi:unnamed protein product [Ambrosiozyma monospora]|uniref:Unnamed protein product n=1 Tax=Ambrosiozyma monospora TaxID=43982 RepID=A0A9W7DI44_AMBMO|nr:unnamed protein product [Ambrosiozyma monospora]
MSQRKLQDYNNTEMNTKARPAQLQQEEPLSFTTTSRSNTDMTDASTTTTTGAVHPIELTVQSVLETPLELLNLNLNSLDETQLILTAILKRLDSKILQIQDNIFDDGSSSSPIDKRNSTVAGDYGKSEDRGRRRFSGFEDLQDEIDLEEDERVDLSDYLNRISHLKETLEGVNGKLDKVDKRVDKIINHLNLD